MTNGAGPGLPQWFSTLQKQAQQAVEGIFTGTLVPIQYPAQGDFEWYFQNASQVFNQGTFDYISANVAPGSASGSAQLSPSGGFPNAYVQLLNKISYALSKGDLNAVNNAQTTASTQQQTLVSDYQGIYGQITPAQMQTAAQAVGASQASTPYDYITNYILGYVWSGSQATQKPPLTYSQMAAARNLRSLLTFMPGSGNQVVTDASTYLSMMQPVNTILSNQQLGAWILQQLVNNTSTPTSQNGGISTCNPNNGALLPGLQVAYSLGSASLASIRNDLLNTGRKIVISVSTSSASGNQVSVSMQGQAGFSVGSWLNFTTSVGTTYDMSKAQGTSMDASIQITFEGFSVVPIEPLAWQQANNNGWFYPDPIAQAVANGNQDVTGFKFVGPTGYNLQSLANGGNFGMLTSLLIANYPSIQITYSNADFAAFKQSWSETWTGNLSLFGFLSLGSFSQGAYGSSFQQGADNSSFTVTFSASPQVVNLPLLQQQAFVIGGSVTNPGVTPTAAESANELIRRLSRVPAEALA